MVDIPISCTDPGDAWYRLWIWSTTYENRSNIDWTGTQAIVWGAGSHPALSFRNLDFPGERYVYHIPQNQHDIMAAGWWNAEELNPLAYCPQYIASEGTAEAWASWKNNALGLWINWIALNSRTAHLAVESVHVDRVFEDGETKIHVLMHGNVFFTEWALSPGAAISFTPIFFFWQERPVVSPEPPTSYQSWILLGWGGQQTSEPASRLKILNDALDTSMQGSEKLWRGREIRESVGRPEWVDVPTSDGTIDVEVDRTCLLLQKMFLTQRVIYDKNGAVNILDGIVRRK